MNNVVGSRVRQARLEKTPKMSQRELAEQLQLLGLDLGRSEISKIEIGERRVTDFEVVKLADVLKVTDSWLLRGE
ncbi:MAG: helix-turn-helix transcriptional regulator [Chloroflexota bacterium]